MSSKWSTLLIVGILSLIALGAGAQDLGPGQGNGVCQFIDEDGDGFNDLAPDADGDGIPNGMDEDFVKPEDGSGNQFQRGQNETLLGKSLDGGFVFLNGNGGGHMFGPADGTGSGMGPGDGTGFGPGTGECLEGDGVEKLNAVRGRGGRR